MEAFEKELSQAKAKDAEEGEEEEGGDMQEYDETELGEDPFAHGGDGAPATLDSGTEPWLGSDRDYTYPEVRFSYCTALLSPMSHSVPLLAAPTLLRSASRIQSSALINLGQALHNRPSTSPARRKQEIGLRQHLRNLQTYAQTAGARHPVHVRRNGYDWVSRWLWPPRY